MKDLSQPFLKVKKFNKDIENEIKRHDKKLGECEASREIVHGTYVSHNGSIFFKVIGEDGNFLGTPRLILKPGKKL